MTIVDDLSNGRRSHDPCGTGSSPRLILSSYLVYFDEDSAGEAEEGKPVGKTPTTSVRRVIALPETSRMGEP